jgi:WD40 repeat protein
VVAAAFTPDGARVVTRGHDGSLRVWPVGQDGAPGRLGPHGDGVDTVLWSGDGRRLLTAGHDGKALVRDLASGNVLATVVDPSGVIHSASWDSREERILTSGQDGVARVWSARTGLLLRSLPPAGAPILFAAWSPDDGRVATAGLDGVIRLHELAGAAEPRRFTGHEAGVTHVVFSPDGALLVSASQLDATVRLWPLDGAPPRVLRAGRSIYRAGLSPRGDLLAVAEADGPLRLFSTSDLAERPPLQAWPERLWAPAWSPDQRRLALASRDGTVRVVALDGTGGALTLRGQTGPVTEANFSPDGRELAIASSDGSVRVAALDWPLLRQRLVAATSACLSTAQRLHLLGEAEDEALRRHLACEQRAGRGAASSVTPPATRPVVPPATPPEVRALIPAVQAGRTLIEVRFPPWQFTGTFRLAAGAERDEGVARDRVTTVGPTLHFARTLEGRRGSMTLEMETELRGAPFPSTFGRWRITGGTGAWAGRSGSGTFTAADAGADSGSPFERQTLLGRISPGP